MGTTVAIIGFDSAWANMAPGAICAINLGADGAATFKAPVLVRFDDALEFVDAESHLCDMCLVAIDQPTIVPNQTGCRPVDRVAASMISFVGGGVQPANRSRLGFFDDCAPFWNFKKCLGAEEHPEESRTAESGRFIIEVFPALALAALNGNFCNRLSAPKYNPTNRRKFRQHDWTAVVETIANYGERAPIMGIADWANEMSQISVFRKSDQDRLDAALCAIVGYHWRAKTRDQSLMIGDLTSGYMIAPSCPDMRARLMRAAAKNNLFCG